ncbi:hypothetical protein NUACC21_52240 [Scytonema sp. NUACC21]
MASGAALVVSIFTKASLAVTLLCLGIFALLMMISKWSRTSSIERPVIKKKALIGIVSGFVATVGYDISRLLLVMVGGLKFWPFETFVLFGKLIIGEGTSKTAAYTVGTMYHFLNGMLFAVAYCFLFGNRNWKFGVLWALALEVSMFTIYPGWLDLKAVMKEFTIVSLSGHMVYGAVLGILAQRWLTSTSRSKLGGDAND